MSLEGHRASLLRRYYDREAGLDGVFIVGVTSTGIYCLPSCPARKPKPKNVVLCADEDEAKALGLRACKRCRPDLFSRGIDLDEIAIREAVVSLRAEPAAFPDVPSLAARAGVGRTKLKTLARAHFHLSPAALLLDARLDHAARALAEGRARVLDAAVDAGFDGASAFHKNFRARFGLTPRAFRSLAELGDGDEVGLELPARFDPGDLLGLYGRDEDGASERRDGQRAVKALDLDGRPARIEMRFEPGALRYRVTAPGPVTPTMRFAAHRSLVHQLGLAQDPGAFERRASRLGHRRLIAGRRGTRMPASVDAFEALVWAIVGQQVHLAFAAACRSALIRLAGRALGTSGGELFVHPSPSEVARLEPEDLTARKFSRRKAEYVVGAARAIASGMLDLESLRGEPAGVVHRTLLGLRGVGEWTARYVLMRGFGFADCVPIGDAGLAAAATRYFDLPSRPDALAQAELLAPFAPSRSLASLHLWKGLAAGDWTRKTTT